MQVKTIDSPKTGSGSGGNELEIPLPVPPGGTFDSLTNWTSAGWEDLVFPLESSGSRVEGTKVVEGAGKIDLVSADMVSDEKSPRRGSGVITLKDGGGIWMVQTLAKGRWEIVEKEMKKLLDAE